MHRQQALKRFHKILNEIKAKQTIPITGSEDGENVMRSRSGQNSS